MRLLLACPTGTAPAQSVVGAAVGSDALPAPRWQVSWIAAHPDRDPDSDEPMLLLLKNFNLSKPLKQAVLYASGLGQDELRINGHKVGNDELTPGWSDYRKTVYYDAYDVTALLRTGEKQWA